MRPNQQNKRSRSRNNNRKSSNPLTRSYESNGPDVRVRGTAAHIAEKYMQLARDANSSGDSVAAENYLQHAEHYFRIISAAQDQANIQQSIRSEQNARTEQGSARASVESTGGNNVSGQSAAIPASEAGGDAKESAVGSENAGVVENTGAVENAGVVEKKEARAPRVRRPRRPRVSEKSTATTPEAGINGSPEKAPNPTEPANEMDPADAPQPELGELPSFVTEQSKTKAG